MTGAGERERRSFGVDSAGVSATLPLRDRVLGWRDRVLGSRRFQRWSAGFALTRPIARSQAQSLFDLCAGFVYSQILLAVVRLEILDLVADVPQTADAIATHHDVPVERCRRLLDAAVALKLLSKRDGGDVRTRHAWRCDARKSCNRAMVEHHSMLYADLADPIAMLKRNERSTQLGEYWAYARSSTPSVLGNQETADYTTLMSVSQALIAEDIIEAYPQSAHARLLDIGGGDGTLLAAIARAVPGLELALFDLPSVAAQATVRLAGIAPGAAVHGGSFPHRRSAGRRRRGDTRPHTARSR